MSGDLTNVQSQMIVNEFVDNLKSLSMLQSSSNCADAIEELHNQFERAIPDGLKGNKTFAFTIIDNLYRIIPFFDKILSNEDENYNNDFTQTQNFLETLANAFQGVCFFEISSVLKDTSRLRFIFQQYITLLKENYFTDNNKYDNLINCLIPIIGFAGSLISVSEDKIPANFLSYLLTFTKNYWQCPHRQRIIENILILIKMFSKKPTLIPLIIRNEWPDACVQWLTIINTENRSKLSFSIEYHIYLIVQKLARHTIGVQVLNQLNCLKAFDESKGQIQKTYTDIQNSCLHVSQYMIYALLMEADDIKQISMLNDDRMCQALDHLVLFTIQASHGDYFFYQCFHISEILSVLSKLFVNDDILVKCLNDNKQLFDCLCQLIIHFANLIWDKTGTYQSADDETLLSLTNLLWSISFHQCYHEKFHTNSMLMHTLTNLAASSSLYTTTQTKSIPRDLCTLKKAAEGTLWNLKSLSTSRLIINEKTDQQPLAMISYSHSDGTFCRELVEHLSAYVPVWVDYKQANNAVAHSDDLWEEIARAMEMATVIILIVSKEYYDSKSCRQELSYASDTLKKRIVPIYPPNQQYRANGWLGIRIAGQKYIHFGRKLFTDAIQELSAMITNDQKPIVITSPSLISQSVTCSSSSSSSSETIPVKVSTEENKLLTLKNWTTDDIKKWFNDNHIHNDLITLYANQFHTGTALIVYARHLKLFYRNEYIRIFTKYYKMFHGKRLDALDFVTFTDALYRLRMEYDPNYNLEDSFEKCGDQQLSCKVKTLEKGTTWL